MIYRLMYTSIPVPFKNDLKHKRTYFNEKLYKFSITQLFTG